MHRSIPSHSAIISNNSKQFSAFKFSAFARVDLDKGDSQKNNILQGSRIVGKNKEHHASLCVSSNGSR